MKNFLIMTAVLTVVFVAIIDTKARIEELDEIAATTPVQVEIKPDLNKSKGDGVLQKFETMQPPDANNPAAQKMPALQTPKSNVIQNPNKVFQPLETKPQMP